MKICRVSLFKVLLYLTIQTVALLIIVSVLRVMKGRESFTPRAVTIELLEVGEPETTQAEPSHSQSQAGSLVDKLSSYLSVEVKKNTNVTSTIGIVQPISPQNGCSQRRKPNECDGGESSSTVTTEEGLGNEILPIVTEETKQPPETENPVRHALLTGDRGALGVASVVLLSPSAPLNGAIQALQREDDGKNSQGGQLPALDSSGRSTVSLNISQRVKTTSMPRTLQSPSDKTPGRSQFMVTDFTAEPQWDFKEEYNMEYSSRQTTCPTSVKNMATSTKWLKEHFLPQISIFMDRRHFSDPNWKRLEHFTPPYGWMELNYKVVKEVVSSLPAIANQQILLASSSSNTPNCVRCAVVGNGGILNNSRLGKEIDAHDYVFRVNGALLKGYEDDVGNRTSFYGFTSFTMLASLARLNEKGFNSIPRGEETRYLHFMEGRRDYEWLKALIQDTELKEGTVMNYRLRPRDNFGDKFDLNKFLVVHPDFIRYIKNRFLRSKTLDGIYWSIYRPTTGALLLMTALHLCDKVSAYGFITDNYELYSDHYYDEKKMPLHLYTNHDFLLERDLWKALHDLDILKLYQRP